MGTENSQMRQTLLDVAEQLMLKEGYAAVGVRRVAREAGVAPALVLYYFRTLDDLFLALLRRLGGEETERQTHIISSHHPLRALWDLNHHSTALVMEFMALANHRKAIRAEICASAERYRNAQLDALTQKIAEEDISLPDVPPVAVIFLAAAVSRTMVMEKALGMTSGHAETLALVERLLRRSEEDSMDPPRPDHTNDEQPDCA